MNTLKQYLPSLGLVLATLLGSFVVQASDNELTLGEMLTLGSVFATAAATYIVPRAENATWLKPAVAVLGAIFTTVHAHLSGGISTSEWGLVGLAALGALGVVVTNKNVPLTSARTGEHKRLDVNPPIDPQTI